MCMKGESFLSKLSRSQKGSAQITGVVVSVVLVTALIPVIANQIAGATNLSATETTILSLTTTFIVLGLIVGVARKSGLLKK